MPASARISIRLRRISHRSWSPRVFLHTRLVALTNTLLAARALGLGATLTTLYLQFEKEAEATLGLPPNVHSYAMLRSAIRWAGLDLSAVSLSPMSSTKIGGANVIPIKSHRY
jgi:hypothetical protein